MGDIRCITDVQAVLAGANLDVQPAAGFVYKLTGFGSGTWVGVPPNAIPQISVGIFDGAIGPSHILRSTDIRGWYRKQNVLINNGNYCRITNDAGAPANVSFSGEIYQAYGTGAAASVCVTDVQTILAGALLTLQPAVNQDMVVRDIGSSLWVGAAPAGLPDVTVSLTDGVLASVIMQATDTRQWEPEIEIYINNTDYITIQNTNALAAAVSVVAEIVRDFGTGVSGVVSNVVAVVGGAVADFQPGVGFEWVMTMTGAATWVGVAPLAFPDVTVAIFDGLIGGNIQNNANWLSNGSPIKIHCNNGNYIRITDTSAAPQNVCASGYIYQQFAS